VNELENETQFNDEIDKCFESMKMLIDESFLKLEKNPAEKDRLVDYWKYHVSDFISYTFKASEKNKNKDIFKAITKALVFGK
jgi:hypothetical protein